MNDHDEYDSQPCPWLDAHGRFPKPRKVFAPEDLYDECETEEE